MPSFSSAVLSDRRSDFLILIPESAGVEFSEVLHKQLVGVIFHSAQIVREQLKYLNPAPVFRYREQQNRALRQLLFSLRNKLFAVFGIRGIIFSVCAVKHGEVSFAITNHVARVNLRVLRVSLPRRILFFHPRSACNHTLPAQCPLLPYSIPRLLNFPVPCGQISLRVRCFSTLNGSCRKVSTDAMTVPLNPFS